MLLELKGIALLNGWRGSPRVDKESIAKSIVKIGELISSHSEIKEMDLNPVRVYDNGLLALDALVALKDLAKPH